MPQQCSTGTSLNCEPCIILCPILVTVPLTYWEHLGAAFRPLRPSYHYWVVGLPAEISWDEDPFSLIFFLLMSFFFCLLTETLHSVFQGRLTWWNQNGVWHWQRSWRCSALCSCLLGCAHYLVWRLLLMEGMFPAPNLFLKKGRWRWNHLKPAIQCLIFII